MQTSQADHGWKRFRELIDFSVNDNGIEFVCKLAWLARSFVVRNLPTQINFTVLVCSQDLNIDSAFLS